MFISFPCSQYPRSQWAGYVRQVLMYSPSTRSGPRSIGQLVNWKKLGKLLPPDHGAGDRLARFPSPRVPKFPKVPRVLHAFAPMFWPPPSFVYRILIGFSQAASMTGPTRTNEKDTPAVRTQELSPASASLKSSLYGADIRREREFHDGHESFRGGTEPGLSAPQRLICG